MFIFIVGQVLLAGEQLLAKGNLLKANVEVYADYVLKFDIKPLSVPTGASFTSILRGTDTNSSTSGNCCNFGWQNPFIYFKKASTKPALSLITLSGSKMQYVTSNSSLPLNQFL